MGTSRPTCLVVARHVHPLVHREANQDLARLPQPDRIPDESRNSGTTSPKFQPHPRSPKRQRSSMRSIDLYQPPRPESGV
jgi:hypothetical protein